ncbi:MAG: DMT family transporter [Methylobacteriaceae bacterium]|nr:DMT family transporter [Methylobacteriaceae bacterium]
MQHSVRPLDTIGTLIIFGLCASWGLNQVAAKVALADIPPLTQAAWRSAGATLILGVIGLWREPTLFQRDRTLPAGIVCGICFALEFVALYIGPQYTSATHAVLFLYTAPFFVALGLPLITPTERLTTVQWAGLALSFLGVALALGVSGQISREMFFGDVLTLLAGALWGATTLILKGTRLRGARPIKALLYQLAVSAIVLGIGIVLLREHMPTQISAASWGSLAYQTLWVVCITYMAWFWMISHYRAGELSAFTFLTPIFGVAAGHFLLGDAIAPGFAVAVALVAGGILLVNWPRKAS